MKISKLAQEWEKQNQIATKRKQFVLADFMPLPSDFDGMGSLRSKFYLLFFFETLMFVVILLSALLWI